MFRGNYDPTDDYLDELAEARFQRQRQGRLMRHPDCRDPDHPGCELCEETHGTDRLDSEQAEAGASDGD